MQDLQGLTKSLLKFPSPCGDYGSYHCVQEFEWPHNLVCFRPLAGIMVLIDKRTGNQELRGTSFRPLAGIMVLIRKGSGNRCIRTGKKSFRPLAGIMVLICLGTDGYRPTDETFPSPCGDYGSYLCSALTALEYVHKFPSPCGDYGSYQAIVGQVRKTYNFVSVPLRGLWFLSAAGRMGQVYPLPVVSVPLRGLWFLSATYVFLILFVAVFVSVPLRGLWFLS